MVRRAIHVGVTAIAVAAVLLGTASCGQPEFTYVKNSGQKTYFKVPHSWHQIGTSDLDDVLGGTNPDSAASQVRQQLWWSVAYDASADPAPAHLLTNGVTEQPIVYARVATLTKGQQNAISLDMLRDMFLPVTADAREAAAEALPLTGFELLHDEVINRPNGLHGIRVVYDYELGFGVLHTFDLTAMVNNDSSKLYLMIIRCSSSCYRERASEIDTVATSFTVRGNS
jgi:hypothetical protein